MVLDESMHEDVFVETLVNKVVIDVTHLRKYLGL